MITLKLKTGKEIIVRDARYLQLIIAINKADILEEFGCINAFLEHFVNIISSNYQLNYGNSCFISCLNDLVKIYEEIVRVIETEDSRDLHKSILSRLMQPIFANPDVFLELIPGKHELIEIVISCKKYDAILGTSLSFALINGLVSDEKVFYRFLNNKEELKLNVDNHRRYAFLLTIPDQMSKQFHKGVGDLYCSIEYAFKSLALGGKNNFKSSFRYSDMDVPFEIINDQVNIDGEVYKLKEFYASKKSFVTTIASLFNDSPDLLDLLRTKAEVQYQIQPTLDTLFFSAEKTRDNRKKATPSVERGKIVISNCKIGEKLSIPTTDLPAEIENCEVRGKLIGTTLAGDTAKPGESSVDEDEVYARHSDNKRV